MITVTIKIKGDRNRVVVVSAGVKRSKRVTPPEDLAENIIHQFFDAATKAIGLMCRTHMHLDGVGLSPEYEKQMRKLVLDLHKGKKAG